MNRTIQTSAPVLDPDHEEIDGVESAAGSSSHPMPLNSPAVYDSCAPVFHVPAITVPLVVVRVPLLEVSAGEASYTSRHLDVRLTATQARTLRGIYLGLRRISGTTDDGRPVGRVVDAVRWLLDNIASCDVSVPSVQSDAPDAIG